MLSREELEYQLNHHRRLEEAWRMLEEDIAWLEAEIERRREVARRKFED